MTKIEQMDLPPDYKFLRQTATKGEMEYDEKKNQYISVYSKTRKWNKQQSDLFFQRIKTVLQEHGTPLDNV